MENRLFLCGECVDANFLSRFPGRISHTEPYILEDYAMSSLSGKSFLVPRKGARIVGQVCPADNSLLWAMDQWKHVPLLRRVYLEEQGLFLYLFNAAGQPRSPEAAFDLDRELDILQRQLDASELGKCDLHLMFPCSFENVREDLLRSAPSDELTAGFIRQLEATSREEFCGDYLQLDHQPLGVYSVSTQLPGETLEENTQPGFLYLSRHTATQSGSINLVFPGTRLSALYIMNYFCGDLLHITEDGVQKKLTQWLESHWGVTLFGTPRAVLFAYNPLTRYQVLKCLAMEPTPAGKLIGPTLRGYAQENIAQYDIAEVYASTKCLVEVEHACQSDLTARLHLECVEIYFVELLLLQTSSTRRICQKVLDYMNSEEVLSGEKNYDRLLALSGEMASAILFFDYDHFLFPTISLACQGISKRFGMDLELKKYEEYRSMLEHMIDLAHEEREKIENDNMNLLLLILTIVQALPTLIETFEMLLTGSWSVSILLSWALSIGICAGLCGLFSLYKRHQLDRTKRRHKRRRI